MPIQESRSWDEVREAAIDAVAEAAEAEFAGAPILPSTAARLADAVLAVCDEEATNRLADQYIADSRVQALRAEDGAAVLDAIPAREVVANWVLASRGLLKDAENYVVIDMTFRDRPRRERYQFVLQRVGKLTPHEARQRAESERDEARAELARLKNAGG